MATVVSEELVASVLEAYIDAVCDAALRLGCPPGEVAAVVEHSGARLVDACAAAPERVVDLAGRWLSDTRVLVSQAGEAAPTERDPVLEETRAGATEAALAALDERRRFALLLRDAYQLTPLAVAVALGLSTPDAQTVVAEARLRLLEARDGPPVPSLAEHRPIAGVGLGTLGALSDGASDDVSEVEDATLPARRRHVGSCPACAAVLDGLTRARAAVAGVPLLVLPQQQRDELLAGLLDRASRVLPTAEEAALLGERRAGRRLTPLVGVVAALVAAVVLGLAVGAATDSRGATGGIPATDSTPSPTADVGSPASVESAGDSAPPAADSATPVGSASADPLSVPRLGSPTPPTSASTEAAPSTAPASSSPSSAPAPPPVTQTRSGTAVPRRSPSAPPSAPSPPAASSPAASPVQPPPPATATVVSPSPVASGPSPSALSTAPGITLSPGSGPQTTTITVSGSGFSPGATVTVTYDNGPLLSPASTTVGPDGGFSATITARAGVPGTYVVRASDGARTASSSFNQTS